MKKTRIKICGIKEKSHALGASKVGADFIGLVMVPSPRRVTVVQAQEMVSVIKEYGKATEAVGVFVNMPAPVVNQIARDCNLDWVQLSGNETWGYCQMINWPLIKVAHIAEQSPEEIGDYLARGCEALSGQRYLYLLDSKVEDRYGGTGIAFDWKLASAVARRFPIIIAGGLTPQNVGEAIKAVAPWGVDVSSGVEVNGVKSINRIKAFIEAVRRADDG